MGLFPVRALGRFTRLGDQTRHEQLSVEPAYALHFRARPVYLKDRMGEDRVRLFVHGCFTFKVRLGVYCLTARNDTTPNHGKCKLRL